MKRNSKSLNEKPFNGLYGFGAQDPDVQVGATYQQVAADFAELREPLSRPPGAGSGLPSSVHGTVQCALDAVWHLPG
jgi:hypothetical protein